MADEINEIITESTQQKRDYAQELLTLLEGNLTPDELREALSDYHESDIAEAITSLSKEDRLRLYKILGDEQVSEIFAYLDDVETFIEELSSDQAADIIEEMDANDALDVLEELDEDKREEIIGLLDEEAAKDIQLLDAYDEDVIGSKMSTNFVYVKNTLTIKQAMKSVIDQAAENDNISTVYVINDDETYCGAFSLRDLVIARNTQSIDDITVSAYPFLYADEEITKCIEDLKDYSEDSIPILGRDHKILGVITGSELVDVVDEEMAEDYAKLAGLTAEEDLNEPLHKSIAKRIPWLIFLMGLGLLVSLLIGKFTFVVVAVPVLVSFQSLILDMSGNSGTQSLAVTIRVITAEDLSAKDKLKFVFKELRVGICNGLILGTIIALVTFGFLALTQADAYDVMQRLAISGCIGIALLTAMITSSLSGTLIPILFKRLKIDPAVASGPMITTINDMIAASVYYGLAYLFLMVVLGL